MLTAATRITMPCEARQVRVARRWLTEWLGGDHPAAYSAVQLLSEAFGNSVLYSRPGGDVELMVELNDGLIRIELIDAGGGSDPRCSVQPDSSDENGRGLYILDYFAKDWGWERLPDDRLRFWYTLSF